MELGCDRPRLLSTTWRWRRCSPRRRAWRRQLLATHRWQHTACRASTGHGRHLNAVALPTSLLVLLLLLLLLLLLHRHQRLLVPRILRLHRGQLLLLLLLWGASACVQPVKRVDGSRTLQ